MEKLSKYLIKFQVLMAGIVLLILSEGFNDMAFLTNQVILEENGNDVIVASKTSDAIKGNESSVMSVSLSKALEQNMEYDALIVIGGQNLLGWSLLNDTIKDFASKNKIVGGISEGVEIISQTGVTSSVSENDEILEDNDIITLKDPTNVEEFVELIANKI